MAVVRIGLVGLVLSLAGASIGCGQKATTNGAASAEAAADAPASSVASGDSSAGTASNDAAGPVAVGSSAPNFTLTAIDGSSHSLSDYKGKTVVLEWFNPDCPFVKANHTEGSLKGMAGRYDDVVWLAINSGAEGKQGHGKETNQAGIDRYGIDYPVLFDEDGKVGKAYGAKTTPHMFVIDPEGTVVYAGAIDNEPNVDAEGGDAVTNYVADALADLKEGRAVAATTSKPYGCSVKYAD